MNVMNMNVCSQIDFQVIIPILNRIFVFSTQCEVHKLEDDFSYSLQSSQMSQLLKDNEVRANEQEPD